jgi:hypothetical protein
MTATRITSTTEYLRYNFTEQERLLMGSDLAETHNKLADIDAEEAVMKAQIKERRTGLEQKVGSLSRELSMGFTMRTVPCTLIYDKPHVGEVEYWRDDTITLVRTRPMTQAERQTELEFDKPIAANPVEESVAAVETFFGVEAKII